jgi:light-regulated signal transduction histidine kinase (bacteriophytochrome)
VDSHLVPVVWVHLLENDITYLNKKDILRIEISTCETDKKIFFLVKYNKAGFRTQIHFSQIKG